MEQSYDYPEKLAAQENVSSRRYGGRRAMDRVLAGENQAISFSLRFLFYLVFTTVVMYTLVLLVKYGDAAALYAENGLLEWLQIGLLMACAIILNRSASYLTDMKQGAYLLSIMPVIASVREMDHILDIYVFDGAWQMIVSALLVYTAYFVWRHKQHIRGQMRRILAIPPTGLLLAGFISVMIFSRIFGQQIFWSFSLQDDYIRLVARIVEESCEIFGYLLLLFGAIELLVFALSCKSDHQQRPSDTQTRQPSV